MQICIPYAPHIVGEALPSACATWEKSSSPDTTSSNSLLGWGGGGGFWLALMN